MIRWIVFSTLSAGLFYAIYCLTLRRDRRFQLSRWYLLLTLVFSIVHPFLSLPERLDSASRSLIPARDYTLVLNEVEITDSPASHTFGLTEAYLIGLALCTAYLLFQVAVQAVVVLGLRRKNRVYRSVDGYDIPRFAALVMPNDDTAPYSFFNQIVVGTHGLDAGELRCILAHESHHVSRLHSFDLVFARLMCCLAWFNPFAWLMTRELKAVHEFQADAASLGTCGRNDYLHLLYRQATGTGYGHITNNFQSINLKKRITMMKIKKTRFGAWLVLVALPVAVLFMMAGCKPAATAEPDPEPAAAEVTATQNADEDDITIVVDTAPEFEGGEAALYKYMAENICYPEKAKADGVQGRAMVKFIIEADGSVSGAEVVRGVSPECDAEALRVISTMPRWKPATKDGRNVRVHYIMPITFRLQ